jgi:hypothetical protein
MAYTYVFVLRSLHFVYIDVKLEFDFLSFENIVHIRASLRVLIRVVMGNFMREQHTLAEWQTCTNWNQINKHYLHYNSFADCLCPLRVIICNLVSDSYSSCRADSDTSSVLKVYFRGFHRRCSGSLHTEQIPSFLAHWNNSTIRYVYILYRLLQFIHMFVKITSATRDSQKQGERRLATGWTTEWSEFEYRQDQEFSRLHVFQTGSGAHPASYPMATEGSFRGGKAAGAWSWPLTSSYCRNKGHGVARN